MKRFKFWHKIIPAGVCAALLIMLISPIAWAQPVNMVANGNFETPSTTNAGQPASWTPESWGTNDATFQYLDTGYMSTNSVSTTVSNYQSGDAKWIFDSVSVTPGDQYSYSDWYNSTASTNLWAQYTMDDGTYQYVWLAGEPAEANWTEATANFSVPSGVTSVSVYHVLNANGVLDLDDVSLNPAASCNPTGVNGLVNGNFEQTCSDNPYLPAGWNTQTYGSSPAYYGYSTDGYNGEDAVTVDNTTANDEAGWTTAVSSAQSNQRYQLAFWQQSTSYLYAYVTFNLASGGSSSEGLMSVPATSGIFNNQPPAWSEYEDNFVTPANTSSFNITIATSGQGDLTLSDVGLNLLSNQTPPNFTSGMISLTFDDDFASQYTNGVSLLKKDNMVGTFYVNASTLGTTGYMSDKQLVNVANDGNEIASHLYHLSDMIEMSNSTLISELTGNIATLHQILGANYPIVDFASPYGSYTSSNIDTVMQYEQSHRTTDNEINTKANLNPRQIHAMLVLPTTPLATVEGWINQAKANNEWLVLVYHGITNHPDSTEEADFALAPGKFDKQMAAVVASGLPVETVNQALSTLLPQLN